MKTSNAREAVVPAYLFLCIILGGSAVVPWSNMVLQLMAVAILAWSILTPRRQSIGRSGAALFIVIGLSIGLIAVQLVPVPPALWSAFPGRKWVAVGFALLELDLPWMPISLAPYETIRSALWLLPPFAIVVATLRSAALRQNWVALAVVGSAVFGVALGAMQMTSGGSDTSPWYLYEITNHGAAVGFFANANHMAILLVAAVPFLTAVTVGSGGKSRPTSTRAAKIALLLATGLTLGTGLLLNGSLAGYGLGAVALTASLFIRAKFQDIKTRLGLLAVIILGVAAAVFLSLSPIENNLTGSGAGDDISSRKSSFTRSLSATADYFPIGSGVGTFSEIYPRYEKASNVDRWFMNHVHNDYIELALETGLPGILLMAVFILWFLWRCVGVWMAEDPKPYERAASIVVFCILLHSLVDFPLRVTSISATFAACVALMVSTRRYALEETPNQAATGGARHVSFR